MRLLLFLLLLASGAASAHEASESKLRVVVVSEADGATILNVRIPAPLLFAPELAARPSPSAVVDAPFLRVSGTAGRPAHHLDRSAIRADPEGFAERLHGALAVAVDGRSVPVEITALVARHGARLPPFRSAAEAEIVMSRDLERRDPHSADAYVDATLHVERTGDLALSFPADPVVMTGHVHLDNVFVDTRRDPPTTRIVLGALLEPVEFPRP